MAAEAETSLVVISNSHLNRHPTNTLSNFTNSYNIDLLPKAKKSYRICVDQIYLDSYFSSNVCPKFDHMPSFIVSTVKIPPSGLMTKADYESIPFHHKIFLPKCSYDNDWLSFIEAVRRSQNSTIFHPQVEDYPPRIYAIRRTFNGNYEHEVYFGTFRVMSKNMQVYKGSSKFYLYVYKNLADIIVGSKEELDKGKEVMIENVTYIAFDPDPDYGLCFKGATKPYLNNNFSPVVYIECSAIKPRRVNNGFAPYIYCFTLPFNRNDIVGHPSKYVSYFHEVKTKQYFEIAADQLQSLTIKFLGEDNKALSLSSGRASCLHLTIVEGGSQEMEDSFFMTVTSRPQLPYYPDNTSHSFSTHLSSPIVIPASTSMHLAAVQCSIPSRLQLPFETIDRLIIFKLYDADTEEVADVKEVFMSKSLHSASEIIGQINRAFPNSEVWASLREHTGCLRIEKSAKYFLEITIRKPLFLFLGGGPIANEDLDDVIVIKRKNMYNFVDFALPIQFSEYIPSMVFLYCSIVRPSRMSSQELQLLRIINLKSNDFGISSPLMHYSFDQLCFKPLIGTGGGTTFHNIEFLIRDQAGRKVVFDGDSPVILDLMFKTIK